MAREPTVSITLPRVETCAALKTTGVFLALGTAAVVVSVLYVAASPAAPFTLLLLLSAIAGLGAFLTRRETRGAFVVVSLSCVIGSFFATGVLDNGTSSWSLLGDRTFAGVVLAMGSAMVIHLVGGGLFLLLAKDDDFKGDVLNDTAYVWSVVARRIAGGLSDLPTAVLCILGLVGRAALKPVSMTYARMLPSCRESVAPSADADEFCPAA